MIDLYYWPTPNGHKISIFLEEAAIPYTIKPINIGRGDQFQPAFLQIAPNNRMPAIVDRAPPGGGPGRRAGQARNESYEGNIPVHPLGPLGRFASRGPCSRRAIVAGPMALAVLGFGSGPMGMTGAVYIVPSGHYWGVT